MADRGCLLRAARRRARGPRRASVGTPSVRTRCLSSPPGRRRVASKRTASISADLRDNRPVDQPALKTALEAARDATARVDAILAEMTDAQARRPSRLPRWTRGHVVTHLARNADGNRNMIEGVLAGEHRA